MSLKVPSNDLLDTTTSDVCLDLSYRRQKPDIAYLQYFRVLVLDNLIFLQKYTDGSKISKEGIL